jgi:hypothetical protein
VTTDDRNDELRSQGAHPRCRSLVELQHASPLMELRQWNDDARATQHTAFVIAEGVTLLHHVSETLLRFFFAHAPGSDGTVAPCPWLEKQMS